MRKIIKHTFSIVLIIAGALHGFGKSDSLRGVLENLNKTATADTTRLKAMNALSNALRLEGNYGEALQYCELARTGAGKLLNEAKTNAGLVRGLKKIIIKSFLFAGNVSMSKGNYADAMSAYFNSLKIAEEIRDNNLIADGYVSVGNICGYQGDNNRALKYYFDALKIKEQIKDPHGIAKCYNNIGFSYIHLGNYSEALAWHFKTLKAYSSLNDKIGMAYAAINLGNSYDRLGNFEEALKYDFMALKLREEAGSPQGVSVCNLNIGRIYYKQNRLNDAEAYLTKGLNQSLKTGNKQYILLAYDVFYILEASRKNFKKALDYYKLSVIYSDSLNSEENTKKSTQLQMNYEFSKKEASAKLEQEKRDEVVKRAQEKQLIVIWSICGALAMVCVFAIYAYRSYRAKQRTNIEILQQKKIIEEKQKEILDSIHYAKRIQSALLPRENYIETVMYKLRNN